MSDFYNITEAYNAIIFGLTSPARLTTAYMDNAVYEKAIEISDITSKLVADKIYDILYLDADRYGKVRGTDQIVDIYYKRSAVINNLMKTLTGSSIDDILNTLPIGAKQVARSVRTQIEAKLIKLITEKLANISVKKTTTYALLKAYGFSKEAIEKYIENNNENLKDDSLNKVIHHQAIIETSQQTTDLTANLTEIKSQDGLNLDDVVNHYIMIASLKLNDSLREICENKLAEAVSFVANKTTQAALNNCATGIAVAGGVSSVLFGPMGPAVGMTTAFLVAQAQTPVAKYIAQTSQEKARKTACHYLPTEFIQVDCSSKKEPNFTEVEDEFMLIDCGVLPTLTNWATAKFDLLKEQISALGGNVEKIRAFFIKKASNERSQLPEVKKNWLIDKDHPKLEKMRQHFIDTERNLCQFDLELMEINEYALGIYGKPTKEGLAARALRFNEISEELKSITLSALTKANSISGITNADRKKEILDQGTTLIEKGLHAIATYQLEIQENINTTTLRTTKVLR